MGATDRHRVAGIDGYGRGAWVAVLLEGGGFEGALIGRSLDEILPRLDGCSAITIDIPIGLPDGTPREADQLARARLGRRRSSVFPTPPRAVLEAPTFAAANEVARGRFGRGVSLQTYGMRSRIFEAERHVRDGRALIEVHPEVSFAELAGEPLFWAKDSWRGAPLRRQLLSRAGITLADELGEADGVPVADVLMRQSRPGRRPGSPEAVPSRSRTRPRSTPMACQPRSERSSAMALRSRGLGDA